MDTDVFDLQEIKKSVAILCFDIFYTLKYKTNIVIYLTFNNINGNIFK